jgi:Autoinducer binding domain
MEGSAGATIPAHRPDAFRPAAQATASALAKAREVAELDKIFIARIERLGYQSAGYLRVFSEGRFHTAEYLFGSTTPGWAARYQTKQYSIDDPVGIATCRSTGAFTLDEAAGPARAGAPILNDSRIHCLFDGLCAPIRAGYDEAYARAGLALLPMRDDPPSLTQRETECLRWFVAGRSGNFCLIRQPRCATKCEKCGLAPVVQGIDQQGEGTSRAKAAED